MFKKSCNCMFFAISLLVAFSLTLPPIPLNAQVMQSSNFQLEADNVNFGGVRSVSSNFQIDNTFGESGTGELDSTNYKLSAGFLQTDTAVAAASVAVVSGGVGASGGYLLINVSVVPALTLAFVEFSTSQQTTFDFRYGRTESYELGLTSDSNISFEHQLVIQDLDPDTRYFYEITAKNAYGDTEVYASSFKTLDITGDLLLNVTNLKSQVAFLVDGTEGVELTWRNPFSPQFDHVLIVYNTTFFPSNPNDGQQIYSGPAERFFHEIKVDSKDVHYYTVFAYSSDGTRSSGALTFVVSPDAREGFIHNGFGPDYVVGPTISITPDLYEALSFGFSDIIFEQEDKVLQKNGQRVSVQASLPFTVKIPYGLVPEVLKTVLVSFEDPTSDDSNPRVFSFLLRVNELKDFYEATIAPLGKAELYPISLTVFNFDTKKLGRVSGEVESILRATEDVTQLPLYKLWLMKYRFYIWGFIAFIILLLLARYTYKRERKLKRREVETEIENKAETKVKTETSTGIET